MIPTTPLLTALLLASLAALRADDSTAQAIASGPVQVAMDRAAKCCLAWLNPEQHHLPTGGYETAHDTGRWWDAMLRYEAATGVRIPAEAESTMMENLRTLTDNPAALLTGDKCNPHNFRESLHAYTALVRYRKNGWAEEQGRRLVATMASLIEADGQMDYSGLAARIGKPSTSDKLMMQRSAEGEWFNSVGSTGRAIEGLVWFHEATGDDAALKLAKRLAEVHLRNVIDPSGKVRAELLAPDCVSHTHSYCGTLRGLLLYGLATGDRKYIDAVANTYRKGLWGTAIRKSFVSSTRRAIPSASTRAVATWLRSLSGSRFATARPICSMTWSVSSAPVCCLRRSLIHRSRAKMVRGECIATRLARHPFSMYSPPCCTP